MYHVPYAQKAWARGGETPRIYNIFLGRYVNLVMPASDQADGQKLAHNLPHPGSAGFSGEKH